MSLKVDHPYYCAESNYYSQEASEMYVSWNSFYEDYGEADIDMNLVFRWDWSLMDYDNQVLQIFIMLQRKGIFKPIWIRNMKDEDMTQVREYLLKHWIRLKEIWKPISDPILIKGTDDYVSTRKDVKFFCEECNKEILVESVITSLDEEAIQWHKTMRH